MIGSYVVLGILVGSIWLMWRAFANYCAACRREEQGRYSVYREERRLAREDRGPRRER